MCKPRGVGLYRIEKKSTRCLFGVACDRDSSSFLASLLSELNKKGIF